MTKIIDNFKNVIANKYALMKGRSEKAEFWRFVLLVMGISLLFVVLNMAFGNIKLIGIFFSILVILFPLVMLVPTLAVSVRRMHDIGKGGGWILINLIPVIGTIWFFLLALKDSEASANRFDIDF